MGEAGYWTCKKKRKLERKQERAKKQEGNAGTSSTKERESHTDIQTDEKESERGTECCENAKAGKRLEGTSDRIKDGVGVGRGAQTIERQHIKARRLAAHARAQAAQRSATDG